MEPTHVISFAGAGGHIESLLLLGVEPDLVDQVSVSKAGLELVHVVSGTDDDTGARISAGDYLGMLAALEGFPSHEGMRIDLVDRRAGVEVGIHRAGAPLVLSVWLSPERPADTQLQVLVTYRPTLARSTR